MKIFKNIVTKLLFIVLITCLAGCSGGKHYSEFVNNGNSRTYYDENGNKIYNNWKEISGNWYYFDGNGNMQKSKWIDNYYVDEKGIMVKNNEKTIDGKTYKFSADGIGKEKPLVDLDVQIYWKNPMWSADSWPGQFVNISNINCYYDKNAINHIVVEMDVEVIKIKNNGNAVFNYRILEENGMLIKDNWLPGKTAKPGDKYHIKNNLLGSGSENIKEGKKYILQLY